MTEIITKENQRFHEVELIEVPTDLIDLGPRARKEYKEIPALANDIKERGLITPIALKKQPGAEKPFLLVAGGRRYSACVFIGMPAIPARIYPETLDDHDLRTIELMENVSRENLTWQEGAWLTEEIHRLQVEKYGEKEGASLTGHSAADTAELLGKSAMSVSRDRALVKALQETPEIFEGVTSRTEALRAVKRKNRKMADEQVAKKLQKEIDSDRGDAIKRRLANAYILKDFFEGIKEVPSNMVGMVEIDPPYGIDLLSIKNGAKRMNQYEEIPAEEYPEFLERTFSESYRVSLSSAWLVCWFGIQWYETVLQLLRKVGYKPIHIPAIWMKGMQGQTLRPEQRLGSSWEPFIYAYKGNPILRNPGRNNIFSYKSINPDDKIHGTERPIELIEDVLRTFAPASSNVLVPFLGSGNTILAAANLNLNAYGFDLGEEHKNGFLRRVAEGTPGSYKSYKEKASA